MVLFVDFISDFETEGTRLIQTLKQHSEHITLAMLFERLDEPRALSLEI